MISNTQENFVNLFSTMDKYVVRTKRESSDDKESCRIRSPKAKQATLKSLKGVVVIEDIQRYKSLLKNPDQPLDILLDTLTKLKQKIPSRTILKSTRIGHVVNKLTVHSDRKVSKLAKEILKMWKKHFEEKLSLPQIEVKSDSSTENLRSISIKHLKDSCEVPESSSLAGRLESEVFRVHGKILNKCYRNCIYRIARKLKYDSGLFTELNADNDKIKDFVQNLCNSSK